MENLIRILKINKITPVEIIENPLLNKNVIFKYKNIPGIYIWYNNITNKYYVGSGKDLQDRLRRYFLPSELKSKRMISQSLNKHGYENFTLIIVYTFNKNITNNLLLEKEQYFIDLLNPYYNIAKLAGNTKGVLHTDEAKLKISLSLSNKPRNESVKANLKEKLKGNKNSLGVKRDEEFKKRITLNSSRKISVYDINNNLLNNFDSINSTASYFKVNRGTISKYIKLGKIYDNKYYFIKENKNLKSIYVYDCNETNNKVLYIFNSYYSAGKYFNVDHNTIKNHCISGFIFLEKYIMKVIYTDD